jgi:hypothetical protein
MASRGEVDALNRKSDASVRKKARSNRSNSPLHMPGFEILHGAKDQSGVRRGVKYRQEYM